MTEQLPPEVLAEIFKWVHISGLNLFEPEEPVDGGRIYELCWPVSSVCKSWRSVAISLPFLWTYLPQIRVRDNYESPSSDAEKDALVELLKELISRAQNVMLHPSFICTATALEGPRMGKVAGYLTLRCSQWESVSITGVVNSISLLLCGIGYDISLLKALRLEFLEADEPPDGINLPMFAEAPMLKSVHISGVWNWNINLDTRSLVHLYDGVGSIIHSICTPDGFPKLTTLETHDHGFFDFTGYVEDGFTLAFPTLKKLVYKCYDTMSIPDEGFLYFPVTPSLEELSISAPEGDIIAHIVAMWDRSPESLPLKSLRILENPLEEGIDWGFVDLLKKLPNLEVLEMAFPSEDDLDLLVVSKGDEFLAPRLKKCSFEYRADDFNDLNGPINKLIAVRCDNLAKKQDSGTGGLATMELIFSNSLSPTDQEDRILPGFADGQYGYPSIQPIRLEAWYGDRVVKRSAYTEAAATIPQMLYEISSSSIDINSFDYKHTLELITNVEQKYKAQELVDFLEANTNICMISTAYAFKTRLPGTTIDKDAQYRRVIRLLQKVKEDLIRRLNEFHWIWETSLEKVWIRYIPDDDEMRSDPDKFANAVLGITDDPWIIEDMRML